MYISGARQLLYNLFCIVFLIQSHFYHRFHCIMCHNKLFYFITVAEPDNIPAIIITVMGE